MAVSRQLQACCHALAKIIDQRHCVFCIPVANKVANRQLRMGVHSYPGPNIAVDEILTLRLGDVLLFATSEAPNLVALDTFSGNAANVSVVIEHARFPGVLQQLCDRILADPGHPHDGTDAVALDHHAENFSTAFARELVHALIYMTPCCLPASIKRSITASRSLPNELEQLSALSRGDALPTALRPLLCRPLWRVWRLAFPPDRAPGLQPALRQYRRSASQAGSGRADA